MENKEMNQQERITAMRAEFAAIGGEIAQYGEAELPPDVEEEFLRQALNRPDRGFLLRRDRGIPEPDETARG